MMLNGDESLRKFYLLNNARSIAAAIRKQKKFFYSFARSARTKDKDFFSLATLSIVIIREISQSTR